MNSYKENMENGRSFVCFLFKGRREEFKERDRNLCGLTIHTVTKTFPLSIITEGKYLRKFPIISKF